MIGRCKACHAKDAHIASLQAMIADYRALTLPQNSVNPEIIQIEQDAILSGRQDVIRLSDEEFQKQQEVELEADRILSGAY